MPDAKDFKNQITDCIVLFVKKINLFNVSDKNLGFFIRAIHVNLPFYLLIFIIYGTKVQGLIILFLLFVSSLLFIYFNGCILSKIEKKLDGEDITIVDPFLDAFKLEKTHKNRMWVSFFIAIIYLSIILLIFKYRFDFTFHLNDFTQEYNDTVKTIKNIIDFITKFFTQPNASKLNNLNEVICEELRL